MNIKKLEKIMLWLIWPLFFCVLIILSGLIVNIARSASYSNLYLYPNNGQTLAEFDMWDTQYQRFSNRNLQQQWSVVFFGYIACPHVCAPTLLELNNALNKINDPNVTIPKVVFVSLDSIKTDLVLKHHLNSNNKQLDDIEHYLAQFNSDFIGIAGDKSQIDTVALAFNTQYEIVNQNNTAQVSYEHIKHSGNLYIVNPQSQLVAIIPPPLNAEHIASDLINLIKQY